MYWTGSKDVKDLVAQILKDKAEDLKEKSVVDVPAGSGFTSGLLLDLGAKVQSFDLFPEFFKENRLQCQFADLQEGLALPKGQLDWVICQEGIEHIPDQLKVFKDLNRVLKFDGRLLLTTPNFSNLRSRFSYFLMESESPRVLPPNEVDSVWFSKSDTSRMYYGHIFSIGIQRLRVLAKLAGFEIVKVHPARVNWSSFLLYLLFAPWIWLKLKSIQKRSVRKGGFSETPLAYQELIHLGNSMNVLCSGHLILELQKTSEPEQVAQKIKGTISGYDLPT